MSGAQPPQGLPGALDPEAPGSTDVVPVDRLNEMYMNQKQSISDRLEANGRGYDSVFAQ